MSNRNVIFYLLLGIVLAVVAHLYVSYGGGEKLTPRDTILDQSMLEADRIHIEKFGKASVELCKTDLAWRITKPYTAEASQEAVLKILDSLVLQKIEETYTDNFLSKLGKRRADFGLLNPRVKIHIFKGLKKVSVFIGDKTPNSDGVFAFIEGESMTYVLGRGILDLIDVDLDRFRMRKIIKCRADLVDIIDIKRANNPVLNFSKSNGRWCYRVDSNGSIETPASSVMIDEFLLSFAKAEVKSFVWPIGATNESQVVTAPLLAGYGLDSESGTTVTIYNKGLAASRIVLGKEAENGLVYALVQDSSAIVMVDGYLKDLVTKKDFYDSRIFPYDINTVSRLAVTGGNVDYILAKNSKGEWVLDSPIVARADSKEVELFLDKILAATNADRDTNGISVSLSTNMPAERISANILPSGFSFANFRSREILRLDPGDVRRIVAKGDGSESESSIVYDKDKRAWIVESSSIGTNARQDAIFDILSVLQSLNATSIVTLKANEGELKAFGLEKPNYTISLDFFKEDALRRNIFIGERMSTGYYATMGAAFDAVFILSDEDVARITSVLVTK